MVSKFCFEQTVIKPQALLKYKIISPLFYYYLSSLFLMVFNNLIQFSFQ